VPAAGASTTAATLGPDPAGCRHEAGLRPSEETRRQPEKRRARCGSVCPRSKGSPEQSDEEIEQQILILRENILPAARQMDGYMGILSLGDRSTGRSTSLTFWESEEAMRASEEAADRLRQHAADEVKEEIAGVERFEVYINEAPSS
jgi:heme-degrading monooxygenase HmoA